MDLMLPFKAGDNAEAKSFTTGYRSAWFRCKINEMTIRRGHLECYLEFTDFPDEKKTWTRLYQMPTANRKQRSSESRQIMLRPPFPRWYRESQLPEHHPETDVIAIVSDPWKVGDLIDWWYNDCYWTGKITKLLGDGKVKIVLPDPPIGEGGYYDADCKDLRPALDWSLEEGWSVPLSRANDKCWYAACLVPEKPDTERSSSDEDMSSDDNKEQVQKCLNGASDISREAPDSSNLKLSPNSNEVSSLNNETDKNGISMPKSRPNSLCKESSSSANLGESPVAATTNCPGTHKFRKYQTSSSDHASVARPDTMEAAIMGLEEVANKVRWLKGLLPSRGSPQSNTAKPFWKLLEKDASGKHK